MKVKALISFSGIITMAIGEEREIEDKNICDDLLQAKYIVNVTPRKTDVVLKKKVKS